MASAMFSSLEHRHRTHEWMDEPGADPEELRKSLGFIRRTNALLGYTRSTLSYLKKFSAGWKRGQTIRILDVATGSGDVPRAILRWGQSKGWDLRVTGVDLHARTIEEAKAREQRVT